MQMICLNLSDLDFYQKSPNLLGCKGVKKLNLERLNIRLGLTTVQLAFLSSVSSKKYAHNL